MNKFYGKIGFSQTRETTPGVWTEDIVERFYFGDFVRRSSRWQTAGKVNDDITISNQLSIFSDPYAYDNCSRMRWVEFMGCKWKVESVEIQYPRLTISFGGVYNE